MKKENIYSRKNTGGNIESLPGDHSLALSSLIAKAGGDLEITRKVKKAGSSPQLYHKLAVVKMTSINQQMKGDKDSPTGVVHDSVLVKRKASYIENNAKKIKSLTNENVKTKPVLPNSINIKQENSVVVNKIAADCKLALQPDLHGNL